MNQIPDHLHTVDGYRKHFMDLTIWEPFVRQVCSSLGGTSKEPVVPGLAGTYPTFIVGQRWVVKFFGELFDGHESFRVEKLATGIVNKQNPFPCPTIISEGELYPDQKNSWLYLVYNFIPGASIGSQFERVSFSEKKRLAGWLGERVRCLHDIPVMNLDNLALPEQRRLIDDNIQNCIQAQLEYGLLPHYLVDQIGTFLETTRNLPHLKKPHHLIHADITGDHILGELVGNTWKTNAIIDFGDAMLGNLAYELNALHLDLFRRQISLLREFMLAYGNDRLSNDELPLVCLRMMLLHRFAAFGFLEPGRLNRVNCPSLFDLAERVWDFQTPDSGLF